MKYLKHRSSNKVEKKLTPQHQIVSLLVFHPKMHDHQQQTPRPLLMGLAESKFMTTGRSIMIRLILLHETHDK